MHTLLILTNIRGQWFVERELSGLLAKLREYCDSIHSCDITVEGPSGEPQDSCWSIELRIRIFDQVLRARARVPEGADSQLSLSRGLADVYARARTQLDQVSRQHGDCCSRHASYA